MTQALVTVRRAILNDFEKVVQFNAAMALETEGKTLAAATLREGVRTALSDPDRALYFIAEVDGAAAGQTMVTFEWSDWRNATFWWIQSVYVDPLHRRRGVFRALHQHIRNEARKRPDVCGLRLYVYKDNDRAQKTYAHLGMPVSDYLLCEEDWSPSRPFR
jgi:GNAT superfamily N-acetyltransferase